MFISVINKIKENRATSIYACVIIFCIIFGFVYDIFSNGVFSIFMNMSFIFPMFLGFFPYYKAISKNKKTPQGTAFCVWNYGIATLTVGSIFRGVTDIYGTSSRLEPIFWISGAVLILCGFIMSKIKK